MSAIMSGSRKIDNFGVRRHVAALQSADVSAHSKIARLNTLSNTRRSNFLDDLVEEMQQKSG
jgi:hypothetical protein